ncbi:type VII secretion-associated protein, Rv3446c family, C-terminal domain-containing protein [Pseudonocardia ammonioxydans]|uniref:Type VII secretion-associated protein, Rv3446c family, C-terminal domain-containing protein n=1 Tax=Pseudonocardia ammonioxydans TaxID=260086 RepID=A0A1I5CYH5_PSUAM|nr:type VII secretion-associated protein [Pseudonocardia ammonioxydans]SFN92009.1 type VII secretion-associated protein, Rv3446c family, C-terminal domain-containing protein [Pseudonocardia ammonioxydans]
MSGYAVAVHARPYGVLLAAADDDGVRLLAAAPPGTTPAGAVGDFFADGPPEVVVRVGTTPGGSFPGTPRVVAVPVAVAVLAVGPEPPPGPVLVVHTGDARMDAAVVEDGVVVPVDPRPAAHPPPGAGGNLPAAALAGPARRVRAVELVLAGEAAADDPEWVAAVTGAASCPVRVAGPLEAGDPAAVAGAGPDTAAVLGAALLGVGLLGTGTDPPGPVPVAQEPPGPGAEVVADDDPPDRMRWILPALALLGVVLVLTGWAVGRGGDRPTAATGVVQYGYAAALPAGWEHTGGDPARRRILLTPVGRPDGTDLIVVERSPLPYDAGREPARARRELDTLLAGQQRVTRPDPAVVAGRTVVRYTQHPGDGAVVDWHVLFESDDQLVVGCRRAEGAAPFPACTEVVGSVRRAP